MDITRKDATIENVGKDDDFPGQFRVILSAPTLDRDGDTLKAEDWKLPLPDHITFDQDHGMSVASTVGSGTPAIEKDTGNLVVEGTYSSLPRAQEVRTLVNEGHIRTTSVAFMTVPVPSAKGGAKRVRELLNGAFVAVPSNREALVLESKAAKAGARNSRTDQDRIDQIAVLVAELGASIAEKADDEPDDAKRAKKYTELKAVEGSLEALQERVRKALQAIYSGWIWVRATVLTGDGAGYTVFVVEDRDLDSQTYRESFTDDGSTVTLAGDREAVQIEVTETVTPKDEASKSADADAVETAAGAPAPAAVETAPADEEAAEIQIRAAAHRLRATIDTDS